GLTSASGAPGGGSAGGTGAPGVPGVATRSGPGVTAKEVYVGLIYDKNAGALNQATGGGAITSGDSKQNETAIIDDINHHGGVGGRKLVPVFAQFDSTSSQTLDQQYAAVCQQFTQDNPKVFAVLGAGAANTDSYRQCISKAGVVMLSDDLPILDAADFARYPALIEQGYANVDRLAAYHVQPLVEQNYFTPWNTVTGQPAPTGTVKVGILTYDDKVFSSAVDGFLVPALKRLGYQPQVAKISQVNTASDYSSQTAAVQAAELSFAQNGVTHIIPFESNGGLSEFFLATARSQRYYPRYGISSASGFQALLDSKLVDANQLTGTVGYGWIPAIDLHAQYNTDNGPYSNAARRYCLKVMKDHSISFTSGNAQAIALGECDALYLIKTVLDKLSGPVTAGTFVASAEGLGSSYENPAGIGQEFRPGRHDPSNKAYHWKFFSDCTCFRYDGALHTIP
nr:ABC transporter substrate-binding protein [Actinomycetota bacterium]